MMMPSIMILKICISMVLKVNVTVVYHRTLGLVMREQNTKLIILITNLKRRFACSLTHPVMFWSF